MGSLETWLEWILAIVIVGSTLAFGAVQAITYSSMEVIVFTAVLLLIIKQTHRGQISLPLPIWPILFAALVCLQVIPLPRWLIRHLFPARSAAPELGGVELAGTLSIYPHDTFLFLAKILAYLCAFVLAAYLFDSLKGRSTLVRILILLGCFEAAYGMVQYLTGRNKIFTYTNPYGGGLATGTYINRNHFAGLLELTLPFVMGLIFYYFERWAGRRHTGAGRRGVSEEGSPGWQLIFSLFLLVVMVMGVVFSHSRGGILATAFTVLFVAGLAQLKARRKIWMVGVFLFVMCVAGYGLWIGLDPVLSRFESLRESGVAQVGGRVAIWKDAIHLVADHPLTGTGLGTFGLAFRPYQAVQVEHFIDHAHNDYVEFACDTGLPGVALLFLPIFYLLLRMIASFLDDPRRYRRAVTLGCIGSTLALLLHSISDFNLQIPANALIFAVVLGIGYKIACVERRADEQAVGPVVAE